MMTSKERAALRAQANPLEVTLIVGKSGISQTLLDEAVILLDSHELVKGRVLETAGLTAREASDMLCEALGAEGIACVGTKFVIWRKSEKLAQEKKKAEARKPAKKKPSGNDNPVKAGLRARKQAALGLDELKRMGVVLKRAQYFITCRGFAGAHPGRGSAGRERITRALIDPNVFSGGVEQLSMFSPPAVDRLVEQGVPPRTAQKMVREEAVQCLARAL